MPGKELNGNATQSWTIEKSSTSSLSWVRRYLTNDTSNPTSHLHPQKAPTSEGEKAQYLLMYKPKSGFLFLPPSYL